jgi:hypothetical protein
LVTTVMLDDLNARYDSNEASVSLLYKYRGCEPHHIACLADDVLWFSTSSALNDPFDCEIRLPRTVEADDVRALRSALSNAQPYRLTVSSPLEVATHIGQVSELRPLEALGVLAAQLGHHDLVRHIRRPEVESERWLRRVMKLAKRAVGQLLHNVTVFCLSELRDNQLMWSHYAAGHTGFCTGYVCPVGIRNPALLRQVQYVQEPPPVTMSRLVEDPSGVVEDLILTKPRQWSYEAEWRVTLGNMPGRVEGLLPYREVILGGRVAPDCERKIREAIRDRNVRLLRAVPTQSQGRYEVRIEPA